MSIQNVHQLIDSVNSHLPNVNNNTSISFLTFTGMNMGQGEKSEKVLGGSGGMLPRKKILNIPYFNASI